VLTATAVIVTIVSVSADFAIERFGVMERLLEKELEVPTMNSELIQDGIKSGFLYNDSTEVIDTVDLHQLMFSQIRTLPDKYYQLWSGYEDASFLSYYQDGVNAPDFDPDAYSMGKMTGANHSCPYNVTEDMWTAFRAPGTYNPLNGIRAFPFDDSKTFSSFCREFFTAHEGDGMPETTFKGQAYDCRKKGWYYEVKNNMTGWGGLESLLEDRRRFSDKFVDSKLGHPAFASCVPLVDPRAFDVLSNASTSDNDGLPWSLADDNGLIGVACTGLQLSGLSDVLQTVWPSKEFEAGTHYAYIKEHLSGHILATSSPVDSESYTGNGSRLFFDYTPPISLDSFIEAANSTNDMIAWSAKILSGADDIEPLVAPYTEQITTNDKTANVNVTIYNSPTDGANYFISEFPFQTKNLQWDIVQVQKVLCKEGDRPIKGVCTACPDHHSSQAGSVTCSECESEFYTIAADDEAMQEDHCQRCPGNADCEGGTMLPEPNPMYWSLIEEGHPEWTKTIVACPSNKEASNCKAQDEQLLRNCLKSVSHLGNSSCKDIFCTEGSTGRLCAVCKDGWYQDGWGTCQKCDGTIGALVAVTAIVIVVVAAVFFVYMYCYDWLVHVFSAGFFAFFDPGKIKVLISMLQIIGSISWTTGVMWPEPFATLANVFSFTQLSFADTIPLGCIVKYKFIWNELLISTLGPIAVGVVLLVVKAVLKVKARASQSQANHDWITKTRHNIVTALLCIAFFVYPTTSLALFRVFLCTNFEDGRAFLNADLSYECFTDDHNTAIIYASLMIAVFPVAIPAVFLLILWRRHEYLRLPRPEGWRTPNRDGLIKLNARILPYKILFGEYKSKRYYWEFIECFRRIILGCVVAVSNLDSPVDRAFWGLIISFVFALAYNYLQPFYDPLTNALAIAANWQIFFTFFVAFIILADPFEKMDMTVLSSFLVLITGCQLLLSFRAQAKQAKKEYEQAILERKVKDLKHATRDMYAVKSPLRVEDAKYIVAMSNEGEEGGEEKTDLSASGVVAPLLSTHISPASIDLTLGNEEEDGIMMKNLHPDIPPAPDQVEWSCVLSDTKTAVYPVDVQKKLEKAYALYHSSSGGKINKKRAKIEFELTVEFDATRTTTWKYTVDWDTQEQINLSTCVRRPMKRVVLKHDTGGKRGGGSRPRPDSDAAIKIDRDTDAGKQMTSPKDALYPPFPTDLEPRAILLLEEGQLVQVSRIRQEDEWCYGIVVYTPPRDGAESTEHLADDGHPVEVGGVSLLKDGGWFPAAYTTAPSAEQIHEYQEWQGGSRAATSALAPPDTWMASKTSLDDEVGARLYECPEASDEFQTINKAFLKGMHGKMPSNSPQLTKYKVTKVRRIENMTLWQSYAAKKLSLERRAKKEGLDSSKYEHKYYWHGTWKPVYEKLYQQGFNRSFAGKNACYYGWGTYFARDTGYSESYAQAPDGDIRSMLACRVLAGEYTKGYLYNPELTKDQIRASGKPPEELGIVPPIRLKKTQTPYDSTTNGKGGGTPDMFVTYHDSQAYAEYIVDFTEA